MTKFYKTILIIVVFLLFTVSINCDNQEQKQTNRKNSSQYDAYEELEEEKQDLEEEKQQLKYEKEEMEEENQRLEEENQQLQDEIDEHGYGDE